MADKPIIGVDVSKGWLDLCISGSEASERIDNTDAAIGAWLDRVGPGLVAFEPTGGYERSLIAAAVERGVPFVRVHPNDIVAFRKSRGIKAKTDRIDARLILAFVVDVLGRRGWRTSIRGDQALGALAARRRQLADAARTPNAAAWRWRQWVPCAPAWTLSSRCCTTALKPSKASLPQRLRPILTAPS